MSKRKTIIFYVNNQEQYYGEFHENTKIKMIKSYFKDIAHIHSFNINYNGNAVINEELKLCQLKKSGTIGDKIIFKVTPNSNLNQSCSVGNMLDFSITPVKNELMDSRTIEKFLPRVRSMGDMPVKNNDEEMEQLKTKNDELEQKLKNMEQIYDKEKEELIRKINELNEKLQICQNENGVLQNLNIENKTIIDKLKNEKKKNR